MCRSFRLQMEYHFNPPAPRGTGRTSKTKSAALSAFQSTRPSRDGTKRLARLEAVVLKFQSTRPSRDGTATSGLGAVPACISIHPPLAGRDGLQRLCLPDSHNFNPPAPRGTGRACTDGRKHDGYFNPPAPRGTGPKSSIGDGLGLYFNPPAPRGTGRSFRHLFMIGL